MKRLFKNFVVAVLLLALFVGLSMVAVANDNNGLPQIRSLDEAGFTDIADDWSRDGIAGSYEMGLMQGTGSGKFDPDGTVTIAQAVMVAARMCDLWQGGDGVIISSGSRWYDGAIDYAVDIGIITRRQFADYDVPATRAEIAGILAKTLPESTYAVLNQVSTLPDVNDSTPYCAEIFTLYRAGILCGSDSYGTFRPDSNITRKEAAAIFCRLARPMMRKMFTLSVKPLDFMVYSTNRLLIFNGVALPGIVEIDGEAFFPAEYLNGGIPGGSVTHGATFGTETGQSWDGDNLTEFSGYFLRLEAGPADYAIFYEMYGQAITDTVKISDNRWPIGKASPSGLDLHYHSNSKNIRVDKYISDAIYLLDGEYPLLRLSKVNVEDTGGDIIWNTGELISTSEDIEPDLVGEAMKGLIRNDAKETVKAIHDYIVNTLTYDPRVSDAITLGSNVTAEAKRAADAACAAAAEYNVANNFTLASRYGICGAYADLFCDMCVRAGIPCIRVNGYGAGFRHAWNKVFIEGKWQYVDCTFDDPISASGKPILKHDCFLVDAEQMVKNHLWEGDDCPMPLEYDPAWEQIDPNSIRTADEFRKCLAAQVHQRKTTFTLRVVTSDAYGGDEGVTACHFWYGVRLYSSSKSVNGNTYTYKMNYYNG